MISVINVGNDVGEENNENVNKLCSIDIYVEEPEENNEKEKEKEKNERDKDVKKSTGKK